MEETILLVDDEADIREVLGIALEDMGYSVLVAKNGEEAVELHRKHAPPIVLTDIKMPRMDGIELLRRIKRRNPEAEVVMITGHGDMDLAIRSIKNEAADFITKPINVDALEIALNRVREKIITREKLKEYTRSLEALVREKTELQGRLSSLGLMIGSISHGIKGLLTGLDGGLYLLDSGLKKEDKAQVNEGLDAVRLMAGRIRKMIMDILHYAKERDLNLERVDAAEFAEEVARVVASKAARQEVEFVRRMDPDLGFFTIDAECIRSALINILENAIDACLMDRSGEKHMVVFSTRGEADRIHFEIRDNGVGMDAAAMEKIFDLFYSSKGSKGAGFGLFIANNLIRRHGGAITVKSAPRQGARFYISVPRTAAVEQ